MIGCYAGHKTDQLKPKEGRHFSSSLSNPATTTITHNNNINLSSSIKKDIIYEPLESVSLRDDDDEEDDNVADDDTQDEDSADDRKRDLLLVPDGGDPATPLQQVMQVAGNSLAASDAQTPAASSPLIPITLGGSRRGIKAFALRYHAKPIRPVAVSSSRPAAAAVVSPASLRSSSLRASVLSPTPVYADQDEFSEEVVGDGGGGVSRMIDGMQATQLFEAGGASTLPGNGRSDVVEQNLDGKF